MRTLLALIFALTSTITFAQELVTDLNGFKLRQYREVPKNELKKVMKQGKFEDGFEYEAYAVVPDESVYMIFEYAKSNLEVIWSIQMTGSEKGYDCKFRGLKLGMTSKEVEKALGKPSSIEDAGEYGKKWVYDKTNYSLEVTPKGNLGSVKIIDMSQDYFPKPDISKIPTFEQYSKILRSGDRKAISELLAPDLEFYTKDSTYFFKMAISSEIKNDNSGIFKLMEEVAGMIENTDPHNKEQYEENVRLELGRDPMHVAKFKSNGKVSQIVFKYMFGKYLIWEIRLN